MGLGDFESMMFPSGYGPTRVSTAAGAGRSPTRNGSQLARLSLSDGSLPLSRCASCNRWESSTDVRE